MTDSDARAWGVMGLMFLGIAGFCSSLPADPVQHQRAPITEDVGWIPILDKTCWTDHCFAIVSLSGKHWFGDTMNERLVDITAYQGSEFLMTRSWLYVQRTMVTDRTGFTWGYFEAKMILASEAGRWPIPPPPDFDLEN
ncbi:MAG TPA: hypothetical protein VJJ22_01740 [Candidatus Paceibacterota bacterium]